MELSHLGHSAVLVQTPGARVLLDPGAFSDDWHNLSDLDAILITHQHPDHLDAEHLPALLQVNPGVKVYVEPSIADGLAGAEPLAAGEQAVVGDLLITAVGGTHAVIHSDLPGLGNIGYVIRSEGQPTFFHPGDSLDTTPDGVDVVAVPAYGPWAAMKETVEFVRGVGALEGFMIHDELLNDRGRALIFNRVNELTTTRCLDLRGGEAHRF